MGACIPYSDNPLTDPDKEKMDSSLYGSWYWRDENEAGFVHIGLDETSGLLRVIMLDLDTEDRIDVCEFMGHPSRLDKKSYLNLKWVRPKNKEDGYIFVKYHTTRDAFAISMVDRDAVIKAIEGATLKGTIAEGKWFSSVRITEGQKTLQQFMLAHDEKLFKETKVLRKLSLPEKKMQPKPIKSWNGSGGKFLINNDF
jgi:hypothetical protein